MQAPLHCNTRDVEQVPKDPRARRLLRQLRAPRSFRERWLGTDRELSNSELHQLYWLVRWMGPKLIHLEGVPGPRSSLMLAAAAADAGCRKIRCPLLLRVNDDQARHAWGTLQKAGLDWMLSAGADTSSARDLLVMAGSVTEQTERLRTLLLEPWPVQAIMGLVDRRSNEVREVQRLDEQLQRLGCHSVLPLSSSPAFWLAVKGSNPAAASALESS